MGLYESKHYSSRSETALLAVAAQLQDRWLPSLHLFSEGIHE